MAALLALAAWRLSGRAFVEVASDARVAEIRSAFAGIPMRLGPWIGVDVPLPAGSQEVLHATGTLSRRYIRVGGGEEVVMALVHCGDARDMLGHYPPSCYPSQGWSPAATGGKETLPLRIGGVEGEGAIYRFAKPEREGDRSSISVVGAFLLPGQRPTGSEARLREVSRDRRASSLGVGQLQFVFGGSPEIADMADAVQELVDSMPSDVVNSLLGVGNAGSGAVDP